MNDKTGNARAAREARETVIRHGGASTSAVEAAMMRYLTAEEYHELRSDPKPAQKPERKQSQPRR